MTATRLRPEDYLDPARLSAERTRIFAPSWQFMGHEREIPAPGDFLAATIAGFPLLVVRSETGLQAFHNVCRHRAGPLVEGDRGHCGGALVCRYHGWTYALDGRLKSARDFRPAPGFDAQTQGLFPLALESWNGFIFVAIAPPEAPLATLLDPVAARIVPDSLARLVPAGRKTHAIACNWKLYVENYLEGYHIPLVHPGLDAEIDSARYQVTMEGAVCLHAAPPRIACAVYQGLWAWIAPNLGLNVYAEGLMWERMLPRGPAETVLVYDYYLRPDTASDPAAVARILAMSGTVTGEDARICAAVQANMAAGIYQTGTLSPRHEAGVAWFQDQVIRRLG